MHILFKLLLSDKLHLLFGKAALGVAKATKATGSQHRTMQFIMAHKHVHITPKVFGAW